MQPQTDAETKTRKERPKREPRPLFSNDELADLHELGREFPAVVEAIVYARRIIHRDIPACVWVRYACARFERDLARIGTKGWQYTLNVNAAEYVVRSIETFREVKGPKAGQRLQLAAWQKFCVVNIFGWVDKATGYRRFRFALLYVPRGNGKTTLAAPIALHMLAMDGEGGAEVYAAAVTRDQARLLFNPARFMAAKNGKYRKEYGVDVSAKTILHNDSASFFIPLSKDASSMDGLNVHFAALDELARHPTREIYDVLKTATGKRTQPLMLGITTAATNKMGIGYEEWRYAQRILDTTAADHITDENYFCIIYTIDEGDDWSAEETWIKANPNWGVSVIPDSIREMARAAVNVPAKQNAFKQKHLNVWTSDESAWITRALWDSAYDPDLKIEDFSDEQCIEGLDLASRIDLAAKIKLFTRNLAGVDHYYVFPQFWLPQGTIDDTENVNASYVEWVQRGYIHTTPGQTNDLNIIEQSIKDDSREHGIEDVAYDPWQAAQMASNLEAADINAIEFKPTVANFSPTMKQVEALVREGRLHHDGNPVMAWCVECVLVQEDYKGNIYPRKDRNDRLQKIDGLIALLMAMGRRMAIDAEGVQEPSITLL